MQILKNQYTDAILYFPSYPTFISLVEQYSPDIVSEDGKINVFAKTPSIESGESLLVYVRLTQEQKEGVEFYTKTIAEGGVSDPPSVEILAQASYNEHGANVADVIYNEIFADTTKLNKYKSVYDFTPYTTTDSETGETITITPPERFGQIAS